MMCTMCKATYVRLILIQTSAYSQYQIYEEMAGESSYGWLWLLQPGVMIKYWSTQTMSRNDKLRFPL